jgi:hypothetical protein
MSSRDLCAIVAFCEEAALLAREVQRFETKSLDWYSVRLQLITTCEAIDELPPELRRDTICAFRDTAQRYVDGDVRYPWAAVRALVADLALQASALSNAPADTESPRP